MRKRPASSLNSQFRGVIWRIYLGACPPDIDAKGFVESVEKQREEYTNLRAKYVDMKLEEQLPPSTDKDAWRHNPWTRSFPKGMPLLETLRRDIERTYSEQEYFQDVNTRKMLERILYIWLTEEDLNATSLQLQQQAAGTPIRPNQPDLILYRQGMNELLAILVIALRRDIEAAATLGDDQIQEKFLAKTVCDPEFLEHDAFVMYRCLMSWALSFYTAASVPMLQGGASSSTASGVGVSASGTGVTISDKDSPRADILDATTSDFARKINRIHHTLLKQLDPALHRHFESTAVEPQLYMLRWIRVLFTREFSLEQVLKIWDRLFITRLELVDYLCAAMVGSLRTELFHLDSNATLIKLMKYPVVDEKQLQQLLSLAERLMNLVACEEKYGTDSDRKSSKASYSEPVTAPSSTASTASAGGSGAAPSSKTIWSPFAKVISSSFARASALTMSKPKITAGPSATAPTAAATKGTSGGAAATTAGGGKRLVVSTAAPTSVPVTPTSAAAATPLSAPLSAPPLSSLGTTTTTTTTTTAPVTSSPTKPPPSVIESLLGDGI